MKVVVLGATKGVGRAIARALCDGEHQLVLLGRDAEDLQRSAVDLEQRSAGKLRVQTGLCDLEQPASFHGALESADQTLERFDTVIVTAALFATQDQLENDTELARRLLTVNFANTVAFCELARKRLIANGGGTLCVISSVAGERGRKPVILYGASKAGLSAYLEGLDHKFHEQGLRVVTVKPGFVKTSMTAGLKPPPFAGEPEQVARDVLKAIERGTPVLYTPRIWASRLCYGSQRKPRYTLSKPLNRPPTVRLRAA
jgi:decaprenylphospho-beta-D-erythro-pentofuranosid-2-ulose 2-reductase